MSDEISWERLSAAAACEKLATSAETGLTRAEAERRLREYGPNELAQAHRVSPWAVLAAQFKNLLIVILLIAVLLSALLGHVIEAIAIAVIVLFAALLGFYQEFRAERALEALQEMAAPTAAVLREGQELNIAARDVVPGDIVYLRAGDKIPADGRLIEAVNLQDDEASLTGESGPVQKQTEALPDGRPAVADRTNMVYAGTIVTYGRGRTVIVATGMATEFGRIAESLQSVVQSKTPLQQSLERVAKILARVALAIVVVIVGLGLLRGQAVLDMIIFGIALAVAAVPEALPAVVTISLALGVQRMARRNALVRRLPAVETLGSVSVICSDKTGTLTKDEMTVRRIFVAGKQMEVSGAGYAPEGSFTRDGKEVVVSGPLALLLQAAVLASDARLVRVEQNEAEGGGGAFHWRIKGDPTEGALVVAAAKAGLDKSQLDASFPRVDEIPFTSETKRMTTLHTADHATVAYAKGAPEVILRACSGAVHDDGVAALDEALRINILAEAQSMAEHALRVLAVAYKLDATIEDAERDMIFLGMFGMIDPPRPEAKAAIETCTRAGIRPIMITGDHPTTAAAVARELGLITTQAVITGAELDRMSEQELSHGVENIPVYARVSPAHKLRIVTALQARGERVAMTGDGINDAPALRKADIGIAMGISGTDVTKEASAMTLTDDNFASIVAAVEEGRGVFENIKKYLMFLLSSNLGEIVLLAGASAMGWPLPLSAVQILYVNLATDGLPALALAVDPHEPDLMRRPPQDPRTGLFTRPVVILIATGGLWSALVNLSLFNWALGSGRSLAHAMTMAFAGLVLIEFFKAFNFRSDRRSALVRPFANKWLNRAIAWELSLLLAVIYVPFLSLALGTYGLAPEEWLVIIAVALTIFPVLELAKWLERRGWFGESVMD
ncbi:MAG TPA: cation-translocating P-type ATPase [Verrucomicrobiae bacterium]|nr:cation-translocating P-type ATPase [Verrucomicrobiae bacterium]